MAYDIAEVRSKAQQGRVAWQVVLGVLLLEGREIPQDYDEAHHWFSEAAKRGVPRAQYHLGRMYSIGIGVPRDVQQARALLEAASHRGEFLACIELARLTASIGEIGEAHRLYLAALDQQDRVDAPDELEEARKFVAEHPTPPRE